MKWKLIFLAITIAGLTLPGGSAVGERAYELTYPQGESPEAGLIQDAFGNLYGTAALGGQFGHGSVYEWVPSSNGGAALHILYSFPGGQRGAKPLTALLFDSAGNLYGTTYYGGNNNNGIVFRLEPQSNGEWSESVLYEFTGHADGANPDGALIFDSIGNLYGTTRGGASGACELGCGVVFELAPSQNGEWTETVLHTFAGGKDGANPLAGVIFDDVGNLYGTTYDDGSGQPGGTVLELSPSGGGIWTEEILHHFAGSPDGAYPEGGVIFDAAGNLYGSTNYGGVPTCPAQGCGVVYELSPGAGKWTESILHEFDKTMPDGERPVGPLIFDSQGSLFGTTAYDSLNNFGTVFRLRPETNGHWSEAVFYLTKGSSPAGGVIFATPHDLAGTTGSGGIGMNGVLFDLSPTVFDH